jgi:hypothetical protein
MSRKGCETRVTLFDVVEMLGSKSPPSREAREEWGTRAIYNFCRDDENLRRPCGGLGDGEF